MDASKLYIYNLFVRIIPETSLFAFKRAMLRWCGARIGSNVRICSSAMIVGNGRLEIGDDVWIGSRTFISSSGDAIIRIGSYCDLSSNLSIVTGAHKINPDGKHSAGHGINKSIVIGDGVWIGAHTTVVAGVKIGEKAVIGAGSVVVKDIPSGVVAVGVPARAIRSI